MGMCYQRGGSCDEPFDVDGGGVGFGYERVEQARAGIVYDAAADFSPTNNPNGVWSYGWSSSLGSTFNLDVSSTTVDGLDFWEGPISEAIL